MLHLTLIDLQRLIGQFKVTQISLVFHLVSRKGAELGYILLLNTNSNPYMGSRMAPLHLTLSDIERLNSKSRIFYSVRSAKGEELIRHKLLHVYYTLIGNIIWGIQSHHQI